MCVRASACAYVCSGQRRTLSVLLHYPLLCSLEIGFSLNLELQWQPLNIVVLLSPVSGCWCMTIHSSLYGHWDLNSGLYAYKPSPQWLSFLTKFLPRSYELNTPNSPNTTYVSNFSTMLKLFCCLSTYSELGQLR